MLMTEKSIFMIVVRVGIYPIYFDRGEIFDLKAFSAVIADLVGVEVADLAFHAVIAIFCFV